MGIKVLSTTELGYALAIRPGNSDLDFREVVDLETMLSVTADLVTTFVEEDEEEEQESLRLVHYTLQEYFELNPRRLFPELEIDMARKCLSYLSLNEFGSGRCATLQLTERRLENFHFLDYAAHHWADHLRGVQTELMDQSLAFVHDEMKISAWLSCVEFCDLNGPGLYSSTDLPLDPAFLAANFHLLELFARLVLSRDINIRNKRGEAPLIRAVGWERWVDDRDPLFLRLRDTDQYAIVQFILDHNADINAKDLYGCTAAFHAVYNYNEGILSLLLDRGANIDARVDGDESLMHIAASQEQGLDIFQLLLDRGADINVLTEGGQSLVHFAADHPTSAMLDRLVDQGALFDVADKEGVTPSCLPQDEVN